MLQWISYWFAVMRLTMFTARRDHRAVISLCEKLNTTDWQPRRRVHILLYEGWARVYDLSLDRALACADEAISLDPTLAEAFLLRATVREQRREFRTALEDANHALILKPESMSYMARARIRAALTEYEAALEDYEQASKLQPGLDPIFYEASECLAKLGRMDDAIRRIDHAISLNGSIPSYHLQRAQLLMRGRRDEEALKELDSTLSVDRAVPLALHLRGVLHCTAQRYEIALADFGDYSTLVADDPNVLFKIGVVQMLLENDRQAMEIGQQLDKMETEVGYGTVCAALASLFLGDFENSLRAFAGVMNKDGHDVSRAIVAWLSLTCPFDHISDNVRGREIELSVRSSERISAWVKAKIAAASCASNGDFNKSQEWQRIAVAQCPGWRKNVEEQDLLQYLAGRTKVEKPDRVFLLWMFVERWREIDWLD